MPLFTKQMCGRKNRLKSTPEQTQIENDRAIMTTRWLIPALYLVAALLLISALVISSNSKKAWFAPIVDDIKNISKVFVGDTQ